MFNKEEKWEEIKLYDVIKNFDYLIVFLQKIESKKETFAIRRIIDAARKKLNVNPVNKELTFFNQWLLLVKWHINIVMPSNYLLDNPEYKFKNIPKEYKEVLDQNDISDMAYRDFIILLSRSIQSGYVFFNQNLSYFKFKSTDENKKDIMIRAEWLKEITDSLEAEALKSKFEFVNYFEEENKRLEATNKKLKELKKELELKNQQLASEIKQKETAQKIAHEKEKEMLSFFTHTMRNALATAPESLRHAIRLLGSEDYEKNQKHYEAINEITSLFSTLALTDCLIDTFKQSIYDTEEFKRAWQQDNTGDATPEWFIAAALRQTLNRIMFMSSPRELKKLLNNDKTLIKPTRKAFIEQVLPLDINQHDIDLFYNWLKSLTAIEVNIEKNSVHFGAHQIKFSLMFAISSELTLNALKYWSGTGKIKIDWRTEQQYYIFSVENACKANASSQLAGTHKGLAFINRLVELLDEQGEQANLTCHIDNGVFTAELKLHKTLLEG